MTTYISLEHLEYINEEVLKSVINHFKVNVMEYLNNYKKCQVGNYNLSYQREGSGESILLIHGITTYSFIWRNMIPLLSEKYDVISVDLLGCGESDKPLNVSYSIKHHSELLKEFIDRLCIRKLHVVGHDVGGGIAQILAVNYPDLLIDLTLINTIGYDFWPVQPVVAMKTPIIRQLAIATFDLGTFKILVKRGVYYKERVTRELMDFFLHQMKTKEGRKAFLHFADCLDNQDLLEIESRFRNLKLPVLIIRGEKDNYLNSEISKKLHNDFQNSDLIKIATGGHFIQEDEPQKLVEIMTHFFKGKQDDPKS